MSFLRSRVSAALFASAMIGAPSWASSQVQLSTIAGRVTDRSGGAVGGALVELAGNGVERADRTHPDGEFRFPGLPPGDYHLTVTKPGFQPVSRPDVSLGSGQLVHLALVLDIHGVEQQVDVPARWAQPSTGVTLRRDDLRRLPAPLDPTALLPIVPGVVTDRLGHAGSETHHRAQFVFRGNRALDTAWTIDGVVVSDRQTGAPPGVYDLEAFEEARFGPVEITQPGNGLGVSLVVRSGGNALRGGARGHFADAALQASNIRPDQRGLVTPTTADRIRQLADYGADLGGPLIRGRAWFWGGASRQDTRLFRQTGGDERAVLTPRTVKVTLQTTSRDRLNGLWLDHGITRFGVNPSAFRAPETGRQHQSAYYTPNPFQGLWKIENERTVATSFVLTARYAYYNTGFQNVSLGAGPAGISPRLGETVGATSSSWSLRPQHTVAIGGDHFLRTGRASHGFRFGAGWQRVEMTNHTLWPGDGIVAIDNSPTDQRARIYREQLGRNRLVFMHAYASDTLAAGRWTIDAGVRLDHQRGEALPSRPAGNPAFPELVPSIDFRGERGNQPSVHVSPRASLAYAASRSTVLRVTGGRQPAQLVQAVAAQINPANATAWIEYPWEDLNGDRLAQRHEVRVDLPYLAFEGFNPAAPRAAVSTTSVDQARGSRTMTSVSAVVEQTLGPVLTGSVGYVYARHVNWPHFRWAGLTLDDYVRIGTVSDALPDGTHASVPLYAADPRKVAEHGNRRVIANHDGYYSTYHGLEASLVRRVSHRWMLGATAAWHNSRSFYRRTPAENSLGNPTPLDGSTAGGPISNALDPLVHGGQVAPASMPLGEGGVSFLNARWQLNVHGALYLPWRLEAAGKLLGRQGGPSPYVVRERLGLDGVRTVLVSPRIDSVRLDDIWTVDMRLARRFSYRKLEVTATAEVFNLMNDNAALVRERNLRSPNFDRVYRNLSPRLLRVGLRISHYTKGCPLFSLAPF